MHTGVRSKCLLCGSTHMFGHSKLNDFVIDPFQPNLCTHTHVHTQQPKNRYACILSASHYSSCIRVIRLTGQWHRPDILASQDHMTKCLEWLCGRNDCDLRVHWDASCHDMLSSSGRDENRPSSHSRWNSTYTQQCYLLTYSSTTIINLLDSICHGRLTKQPCEK